MIFYVRFVPSSAYGPGSAIVPPMPTYRIPKLVGRNGATLPSDKLLVDTVVSLFAWQEIGLYSPRPKNPRDYPASIRRLISLLVVISSLHLSPRHSCCLCKRWNDRNLKDGFPLPVHGDS